MSELFWMRGDLWPWLLLAPVVGVVLWRGLRWATSGGERYGAPGADRPALAGQRAALWTAAAACLWLTWMEPQLGEETVTIERRGLDVIFCLDTSRSMLARDLEPNRLERAKRDIRSVLPELIGGDRVGLLAFAGGTKLVVPLTHDLDSFRFLLDQVDTTTVLKGGTDLAAAIRTGIELADEEATSTTVIVLLTDGEDLTGAGRQAAREAADRGIVVHTVGYGSTRGSKIIVEAGGEESFLQSKEGNEVVSALDAEGLRGVSEATGGQFVRADVMPLPLVELKRKRIDPMLQRAYEAGEEVVRKTRFQWVLLPALLLLIWELIGLGGRRR